MKFWLKKFHKINYEGDILKQWNDDTLIVPLFKNEQYESHGNKLKAIVHAALTNNKYGFYQIEMLANVRGPKLHYHKELDEIFISNEGILTPLTAKGEIKAAPGTVIHIPRLSVHGYNNNWDGMLKMTMIFNLDWVGKLFLEKCIKCLPNTSRFSCISKIIS
ncbi:hypothetical protein [Flavobacterium flavigenum]|uniref:hypothetical protein n=1 Tax=Flavobacterium flavigenum TaxID=3003258 RepID=UPI00248243EA|nr:hypothetical protein [Flavobacterium flavigenum]